MCLQLVLSFFLTLHAGSFKPAFLALAFIPQFSCFMGFSMV